jgi:hypothetical protein
MQLFNKYKNDLFMEILKIININSTKELLTKKIRADVLKDQDVLKKFNDIISDIKIFYSSDKLTCLHHNSIYKQKNPGVNFLRQILKVHNYKLKSISIYKGLFQSKRVYNRYYYVVVDTKSKPKLLRTNSNPDLSNTNSTFVSMPNSFPNNSIYLNNNTNDITSSAISSELTEDIDENDDISSLTLNSTDTNFIFDNYNSFDFE